MCHLHNYNQTNKEMGKWLLIFGRKQAGGLIHPPEWNLLVQSRPSQHWSYITNDTSLILYRFVVFHVHPPHAQTTQCNQEMVMNLRVKQVKKNQLFLDPKLSLNLNSNPYPNVTRSGFQWKRCVGKYRAWLSRLLNIKCNTVVALADSKHCGMA